MNRTVMTIAGQKMHLRVRRVAATCAVAFFLLAMGVALAGADWPPPPRFALLVVAFAVMTSVATRRLQVLLLHRLEDGRVSRGAVAAEGAVAGAALGAFMLAVGGGEPSVSPGVVDFAIWFLVLGMLGAVGFLVLWSISVLVYRISCRRSG